MNLAGSFIDIFVGAFINYVGAVVRFAYGYSIRRLELTNRKYYSLHEYVNGPDQPEDIVFDVIGHKFINKIIGIISIVMFIFLMIYLESAISS